MNTYPICDCESPLLRTASAASFAVTGIAPPQPLVCEAVSPIRYDFLGGAKVVWYGVPQTVAGLFSAFGRF